MERMGTLWPFAVGPSSESNVVVVDSVRIYGKSKEAFGWTEELEEAISASGSKDRTQEKNDAEGQVGMEDTGLPTEKAVLHCVPSPIIPEIFLMSAFETLDWYFKVFPNGNVRLVFHLFSTHAWV